MSILSVLHSNLPYSLSCGHAFCGECLLFIFQTLLGHRVKSLALHQQISPDLFMPLPTTFAGRDEFVKLLEQYGATVDCTLNYYCPLPFCVGRCAKAPVLTYTHGRLVETFLHELQEYFGTSPVIVPATGTGIFDGLFQ